MKDILTINEHTQLMEMGTKIGKEIRDKFNGNASKFLRDSMSIGESDNDKRQITMTNAALSKIMSRNNDPSSTQIGSLLLIANTLDVSIDYLVGRTNAKKNNSSALDGLSDKAKKQFISLSETSKNPIINRKRKKKIDMLNWILEEDFEEDFDYSFLELLYLSTLADLTTLCDPLFQNYLFSSVKDEDIDKQSLFDCYFYNFLNKYHDQRSDDYVTINNQFPDIQQKVFLLKLEEMLSEWKKKAEIDNKKIQENRRKKLEKEQKADFIKEQNYLYKLLEKKEKNIELTPDEQDFVEFHLEYGFLVNGDSESDEDDSSDSDNE